MDARLLAKIALRVLAVYMISIGILELPQIATMNIASQDVGTLIFFTFMFMEVAPFALGVTLWLLAPRIGDWMVGKSVAAAPAKSVSTADLQTIAFVTIGLLIAIQAGAYIIGVIYSSLLIASWPDEANRYPSLFRNPMFGAQIAKLVLGLALLFGAKFFTRLFRRFREFGLDADS